MNKKLRFQEDWEIFSIGPSSKVTIKRVERNDLEFLSDSQIKFLQENGFVFVYHYTTGNY